MSALESLFVLIAALCAVGGCANVLYDEAVDVSAISATSEAKYFDSAGEVSGTIYFDYDKYDLSPSSFSQIRQLANEFKSNSSLKIRVEGHCDERGTREYNLALGEKRAKAVAEVLILNGVPSNKITTVSYGEEKPVAYGSTEASWAKNRRAELRLL